jgi:hypothetical protein
MCCFVTKFEEHIFVTVIDEEYVFFCDLITSYFEEKETAICKGTRYKTKIQAG